MLLVCMQYHKHRRPTTVNDLTAFKDWHSAYENRSQRTSKAIGLRRTEFSSEALRPRVYYIASIVLVIIDIVMRNTDVRCVT